MIDNWESGSIVNIQSELQINRLGQNIAMF